MQWCSSSACSWALGRRLVFTLGALLMFVLSTQSVTAQQTSSLERSVTRLLQSSSQLLENLDSSETIYRELQKELTGLKRSLTEAQHSEQALRESFLRYKRAFKEYSRSSQQEIQRARNQRNNEAATNRLLPVFIGASAAAGFITGLFIGIVAE